MSHPRILSVFVALIALAATLAACGSSGSDDPQSVVDEATLQGIESGKLDLAAKLDVQGKKSGKLDLSLSGPFQSEAEAEYPELDLSFAANGKLGGEKIDREGGFTLLGNKAYIGYDGSEYEVDSTTFGFVKSLLKRQSGKNQSADVSACQEAAGDLEPKDFVDRLKDEGSADVGGTETTKVSGDLDASGALEAVTELIEDPACNAQLESAGPLPSLAEIKDAKGTIENSVKSAHVELYVGDDHIVRRIVAEATIEPQKDSKASAKRVDLDLDLILTGVNEEQSISAPARTRPLSDLFLKLGINPIELLQQLQGGGTPDIGGLLEKLGGAAAGGSAGGGKGKSGGGQTYYDCLGEAKTPVDIQNCTGLLQ
ncbi:MAG TPA: hypothetical protein VG898_12560 [Solirubrobacterales bacterium]|nr:hypothetical protein [Solirubrobacterales bacterium]